MLHLDRIAVISDIHGNLTALEAVLADIEQRGIERIINLGDVIGKGPRGSECIALSRARCEVTVRGNWDTFVSRDAVQPFALGQWARDRLSDDELVWLSQLPNTYEILMSGRRARFFHASQVDEFTRVRYHHSEDEFRGMFTNTSFTGPFTAGGLVSDPDATPTVIGYGDIHGAYLEVDEGLTLFNAGAVGNHLDAPSAPYCILEGRLDEPHEAPFGVQFIRVDYDIDAEIAASRELDLIEVDAYEAELRHGIYRGFARPAALAKD